MFALTVAACSARALHAQSPATGVVHVTVFEDMGMVGGLRVSAAGRSTITDSLGIARLTLPVGQHTITVRGIGYRPAQASVDVLADSTTSLAIAITMAGMMMGEVRVTATRIERLAGETPTHVEVVEEMEVDENTLMAPGGVTMLLNETPGLRVLAASPALGTGSVRILGLPGQYTSLLADGLPLYGATTSALGPLDVSPVDLQRVEIIKGAASALYGSQALGGVINLVSKAAGSRNEILVNRRTMSVTDAATWLSREVGPFGVSLLASGTTQEAMDIDRDGWLDQSRARRWAVRPRYTWDNERGHSLFLTAGYGYDGRAGGTAPGAVAPAGSPFRQALTSRRADIGGRTVVAVRDSGNVAARFALSGNRRSREFGLRPEELERNATGFLEITTSLTARGAAATLGTALQVEHFRNNANSSYDHRWTTPSAFATTERAVGPLTLSVSARSDFHPAAGTQFTERIALLAKPGEGWSVRASAGTAFSAPTAAIEETEEIGLRALRTGPSLRPERSTGFMTDINGRVAGADLLITAYHSRIRNPVALAEIGDGTTDGVLRNASGPTNVSGVEGAAIWRFDGGKFLGTYGYSIGSRHDATTGLREPAPLLPRHRVGGDLMFEKPGAYRGGIEGTWYGRQHLEDNPYRTASTPYFYMMAIYMRQWGPVEAVLNLENLLDVRMTDTQRLVRPAPATGGRWTTDVWAPVEGFMANTAIRLRW